MSRFTLCSGIAVLVAIPAVAGPAWVEPDEDDAGSLPGDAQFTQGEGSLSTITGVLGGAGAAAGGLDDFEDMYVIRIDEPMSFTATTAFPPGFAEFDSRLYLFEVSGLGLLGNEDTSTGLSARLIASGRSISFVDLSRPVAGDIAGACCFPDGTCDNLLEASCADAGGEWQGPGTDCKDLSCDEAFGACCDSEGGCEELLFTDCLEIEGEFQGDGTSCKFGCEGGDPEGSTMGNTSTDDGPVVEITEARDYLIAITVAPQDPVSAPGAVIFDIPDGSTEVSSPDGPGGDDPITDWEFPIGQEAPAGAPGAYTILFTGTGFGAPPCPADLDFNNIVNVLDLLELLTSWGPCPDGGDCPADLNGDGAVDFFDLVELLLSWGACPDGCPWDFNGDDVVDEQDVAAVLENFGPCEDPDDCPWDLDGNGFVGLGDLWAVLLNLGPCP